MNLCNFHTIWKFSFIACLYCVSLVVSVAPNFIWIFSCVSFKLIFGVLRAESRVRSQQKCSFFPREFFPFFAFCQKKHRRLERERKNHRHRHSSFSLLFFPLSFSFLLIMSLIVRKQKKEWFSVVLFHVPWLKSLGRLTTFYVLFFAVFWFIFREPFVIDNSRAMNFTPCGKYT